MYALLEKLLKTVELTEDQKREIGRIAVDLAIEQSIHEAVPAKKAFCKSLKGDLSRHIQSDAETFADRLRLKMWEMNMRQVDVVNETGSPKSAVNHWFSGRSEPSARALFKLARALKVDPEWLIMGDENE